MISKRAYLVKPRHFEIHTENISIKEDEILVKIAVCGLCNWELNHWKGTSEYYLDYPKVIGHEWAGTVVEVGDDVSGFCEGDKVTVLPGPVFQGFAEYCATKASECYKLQKDVELQNGMGEPLKCIVTVLRAATPEVGDCGVILGCGPMGLWCIQALSGRQLSNLVAVDIDRNKLELAEKFGATRTVNPLTENTEQVISELTGGHMADFVIEGTGIPRLLNEAMNYLRSGAGRLVLMSSHEAPCEKFDFRPAIERGLDIKIAHPGFSKEIADDMRRAVELINNGTFQNDDIISHRFQLDDLNEAFRTLEHKPENYIKGIIEM